MCIIVWVFAETGRRSLWGLDLDIVDVERAVDIGPVLDDDSDVVDLRRSTVESPFDMVPLVRSDAEDERTDPTVVGRTPSRKIEIRVRVGRSLGDEIDVRGHDEAADVFGLSGGANADRNRRDLGIAVIFERNRKGVATARYVGFGGDGVERRIGSIELDRHRS